MSSTPIGLLLRTLTRTAGLAALLRALPAYAALALASSILFAPNGMRATDLLRLLAASPTAATFLWGGWIALTLPAARAVFETSTTFFLRSLPVPPWHFWIVHAAHLFALQTPWMLLWLRGEGALAALAAGAIAGAAAAIAVARLSDARDLLAVALVIVGVAVPLPAAARLALGLVAGGLAIPAAWRRAASRGARRGRSRVGGSAVTALLLTHAVVLARRDTMTLIRALFAVILGAIAFALFVRNNGSDAVGHEAALALLAGTLPLAIAVGGVAARTLETERRLEWLLLSTGASARLRALTALAVPTIAGALAGLVQGGAGALIARCNTPLALEITALCVTLGAALGVVAAFGSRHADQPSGVDGARLVTTMIAAVAVALALIGWLGIVAIATIALAAIVLAAGTVRVLVARDRVRDPARDAAWGAA